MKLLRTIRFDGTDTAVFDVAAVPEELAVSGGIAFAGIGKADLVGKTRQAFSNGFLGLPSGGRSTFATVADVSDSEVETLRDALEDFCVSQLGAPDREAAVEAAGHEITFAQELCADAAINTVFTVRRTLGDDGEISEEFRTITPPSGEPIHAKIWAVEHQDD